MKLKFSGIGLVLTCSILIFLSKNISAQDEAWEKEEDTTKFFIGANIGVHFPNNNTANIYSGRPDVTAYGIDYILNQPYNRQAFDDYFKYPYRVAEYPFEPEYKNSLELGIHTVYLLSKKFSLFFDFNSVQLDYEQFFTIAIDDHYNQIPGPTYKQYAIIGEEERYHINLGTQLSFFNGESSNAYFSIFGNLNNVRLQRNYIVINNVEYPIFHQHEYSNQRIGGISYGGGGGLGFKFQVTEQISADIYYNFYYTSIKMKEDLNPYGLHHSLGLRVLWGN